jgi:hypothetical protein
MVQDVTLKADCHSACQKISFFLMEPEVSLPCSNKPTTGPYPEPAKSSLHIEPYLQKVHLNIIFLPKLGLPSGLLHSGLPTKILWTPLPSHACHMSRPIHPLWSNHHNKFRWRIRAVKLIIMQFSPGSFRSKYFSQKPSVFVPTTEWETKFRTHAAQMAKL